MHQVKWWAWTRSEEVFVIAFPHPDWVEINHKKTLHFLARPIIWPGAQIFIKKTINHTWAPSATLKRPNINTGKGTPVRTRSRTIPIFPVHAVRRHQSCLHKVSGSNRKILHGPNRKVPSYIQQGQQLYTGRIPLWLQHHPCRTSENNIRHWFKYSLLENPQPIDQQRVET